MTPRKISLMDSEDIVDDHYRRIQHYREYNRAYYAKVRGPKIRLARKNDSARARRFEIVAEG